jgi:hypothetical protein
MNKTLRLARQGTRPAAGRLRDRVHRTRRCSAPSTACRGGDWDGPWQRWTRRAEILIPSGAESSQFSAARIFAAAYPEAVTLAGLIASPVAALLEVPGDLGSEPGHNLGPRPAGALTAAP